LYIGIEMTDWKSLAAAADPPVPESDLPRLISSLEGLEKTFRPLQDRIPIDGLMWSGPRDIE
jgi:hypothetical protein